MELLYFGDFWEVGWDYWLDEENDDFYWYFQGSILKVFRLSDERDEVEMIKGKPQHRGKKD